MLQPVEENGRGAPIILPNGRKKDFEPLDLLVRAGTVAIRAKEWGVSTEAARTKIYGDDVSTKEACEIILRAASAPAMTTVTGWAAELVQPRYEQLLPLLMPRAILTRLAPRGLTLDFGGAGKIVIPMRSRTPTIAGSFVGEGLPIPVRQGAFTSQTLTPKKVAVISCWTREMDEYSTPAIEGVVREAIQDDTSVAVDSVLLDANAATVVRPAGILNGVAALTATAGGGIAAIVGDIKQLVNAITVATYGNVRSSVWLMNPSDVLSASLVSAASTGVFPFKEEIARGTLATVPIIDFVHGAGEDGDPDRRGGFRFRWRRCTTLRNERQRYAASRRYDSGGIGCRRIARRRCSAAAFAVPDGQPRPPDGHAAQLGKPSLRHRRVGSERHLVVGS